MPSFLSIGLLHAGPFLAIAFVARGGDFRASKVVLAAVVGQILGIVAWMAVNKFFLARFRSGQEVALLILPQAATIGYKLVSVAMVLGYALAVAAIILFARWAYVRAMH